MLSPCPKCNKLTSCGCKSCRARGETPDMTTFDKTGELMICPFCNEASTSGEWESLSYDYYDLIKQKIENEQKTSRTNSDPGNVSIPTDI